MMDVIVKAKLVTKQTDLFSYTTYAFQNLESLQYILCTRFPNWEHKSINIGEEGILHFREVIAGEDKWYRDGNYTPYNYTGWHFIKFIPFKENESEMIIN